MTWVAVGVWRLALDRTVPRPALYTGLCSRVKESRDVESPVPLVCPFDQSPLSGNAQSDGFTCRTGAHAFPVVGGIPRFVDQANYATSFGLQWNRFRTTQLDSHTGTSLSRDRLTRLAGGSLDLFRGRTVLEAGCGAGRFTEILLAAGARVFATDLSNAVEANRANCGARSDYFVCQADLRALPVAPAQFDIVICVGVVQHTPDPEATMAALCAHVKPGGTLVMDHYSPDYPTTPWRRRLRTFLLPRSPGYSMAFCRVLVAALWPLHRLSYRVRALPVLRSAAGRFVGASPVLDYQYAHPELGPALCREWAILDTHDTLTDRYKHLRSAEQIDAHLRRCGMEQVVTAYAGNGVEVRAVRPAGDRLA